MRGKSVFCIFVMLTSLFYPLAINSPAAFAQEQPKVEATDLCAGVACDDGNSCTKDYCESSTGQCTYASIEGCKQAVCGDNVCDSGESETSCNEDCGWCGDGTCSTKESALTCTSDCGKASSEQLLSSVSISLSSSLQSTADAVVNYVNDCANRMSTSDYYALVLECKKAAYNAKKLLTALGSLSESEWDNTASYIMLHSAGTPEYWIDADTTRVNTGWKQVVSNKLNLNLWYDSNNDNYGIDLSFDLKGMGIDSKNEQVKNAENDYWQWEDTQRRLDLASKISVAVSGDSSTLANELIDLIKKIYNLAKDFNAKPSADLAYQLSYEQRIAEGQLRSYKDKYSADVVEAGSQYAMINSGVGVPDIWEDQWGDPQLNGLKIYKSEGKKNFEVNFNRWYNENEGFYDMYININFDKDASKKYKDEINKGRMDAEDKARQLEMAGKLATYLETFTISDVNKEIAKELVNDISSLVDQLKSLVLSAETIYKAQYNGELLRGKMEGIAQALDCDAFNEVSPYVLMYSPGSVNIWETPEGDQNLDSWKEAYKSDTVSLSINAGKCDDYSNQGWMGVDLRWGKSISKNKAYTKALKQAREDSWIEVENLRRKHLAVKARQQYTFDYETEQAGKVIIGLLESFKAKILDFEQGTGNAYDLQYESILLQSDIEGLTWAYGGLSDEIGMYVILYGPGSPDIWKNPDDELEVGNNLRIHETKNLKFAFNRWYDEGRDAGGFNVWLDWGELRKQYKAELKKAEKEAWKDAEIRRKMRLAEKYRTDLEESVEGESYITAIKDFINEVNKYLAGESTAYNVEVKRLEASDSMRNIDKTLRDYILVSDLGEDVLPPEIWWNDMEQRIDVGGWRELIKQDDYMVAGMDGWCAWAETVEEECNVELRMDWRNWEKVRKELDRANEFFWRQKREKEISPKLNEITSTKSSYSESDQALVDELINLIATTGQKGGNLNSLGVSELQYQVLVDKDRINDKLDEADNQNLIEVVAASAEGFHEYDKWADELRGVVIYTDLDIDIVLHYNAIFTPFFISEKTGDDYEANIEIIWKNWTPDLQDKINSAFERYEKEQSKVRLQKLVDKREDIVSKISESNIKEMVDAYESGSVSMANLKQGVNELYFKLQGYDSEVAFLAAISNQPFPSFTPVNIVVRTAHVNLALYERKFTYRFGGGIGLQNFKFGELGVEREIDKNNFAPVEVQQTMTVRQLREDVQINEQGEVVAAEAVPRQAPSEEVDESSFFFEETQTSEPVMKAGEVVAVRPNSAVEKSASGGGNDRVTKTVQAGKDNININVENVVGDVEINIYTDDEVAKDIQKAKIEDLEKRVERIENIVKEEKRGFEDRKIVSRKASFGGKRITIDGLKPHLKLSVDMTDAEIMRIAEELKAKWQEMANSGLLDELVYQMNLNLDNFPDMQNAIAQWGSTTTSLRLQYKGQSIFEFSWRTEDGYIAWIKYGIEQGAGSSSDNAYIELDFETLMSLRNWWEQKLKNAESFMDVIGSIPSFIIKMVQTITSGEIKIQPFSFVLKIPKFLQVFFGAIVHTTGVEM